MQIISTQEETSWLIAIISNLSLLVAVISTCTCTWTERNVWTIIAVLSISFEVDHVPTGKVGGRQLFKCQRRKLNSLGGLGAYPHPRNFWNLDAWKCYFQCFPDSVWALRTIKIKTILTIFYVYYNRSFLQNLNRWLLEKSEMINNQMLIQKIRSMF